MPEFFLYNGKKVQKETLPFDLFSPGIPIGEVKIEKESTKVILFSDLDQITFVNINLGDFKANK